MRKAVTTLCILTLSITATSCFKTMDKIPSAGQVKEQAQKEMKAKHYKKAIKHWKRLTELEPTNSEAFFWLGDAYFRSGNYDAAEDNLKKSLNLNMKNGDAMFVLADLYIKKGMYEEAEALLKKVREFYPEYPGIDKMLRELHARRLGIPQKYDAATKAMKAKKYDEALGYWQSLAKLDPTNSEYFFHIANVYNQKMEYGKAEQNLKQSLKLDPKNKDAMFLMANIWHKMGRDDEAMGMLKRLEKLDPKYPGVDKLRKAIEKSKNS